jgi:hypothetical protein
MLDAGSSANSEFGIPAHPPTEKPQITQMNADLGVSARPPHINFEF